MYDQPRNFYNNHNNYNNHLGYSNYNTYENSPNLNNSGNPRNNNRFGNINKIGYIKNANNFNQTKFSNFRNFNNNNSNNGNIEFNKDENGNINADNHQGYNNNINYNRNNTISGGYNSNPGLQNNTYGNKLRAIQCYRCKQHGHKASVCPYSMEQIRMFQNGTNNKEINLNNKNTTSYGTSFNYSNNEKYKAENNNGMNTDYSMNVSNQNGISDMYPEIVAVATRKNKNNDKKTFTPYKVPPGKLKDNPVPISTAAMNHNKTDINDDDEVVPLTSEIDMEMNEPVNINNPKVNNTDNHEDQLNNEKDKSSSDEQGEPTKKNNPTRKNSYNDTTDDDAQSDKKRKTEKLQFLDLSFINQPNITNAKKKNKLDRINELSNLVSEINEDNNKADESLTKNEKHIKILEKLENMYIEDLIRDIVSTEVKTKLVNLLDWFPKFRSEFIKSLKLTSFKNPALNVMSLFSRNKIIKVPGEVENNNAEIFLDTCSSVNLITKSALKKFQINKPCIGTITETFLQAFSNNNSNSSIYELSIKIGDLTFSEYFRLVDKDDIFDILIGVDSLKRNRFVINLVDDTLYFMDL
ncbi:hypothetical protein BCR36DRAFT_290483, partial [Piromyces finnis]